MMNILGPDQIRAMAERNASPMPKQDSRPLTLPWPETALLPGEKKTVQVLPKAAIRMERMIVSVHLVRQTPEEIRQFVKETHARTVERLQSELDSAVAYKDALVAGTATVDEDDDDRPLTVDGAHAVITRARERLAYAQTPEGFRFEESRCLWSSANPKLEQQSVDGAKALVLADFRVGPLLVLEDVFPCPAVKFLELGALQAALRGGENPEVINPGVQAELFAKTPIAQPGVCLSLDLQNTGKFPLMFRAATFCRAVPREQ